MTDLNGNFVPKFKTINQNTLQKSNWSRSYFIRTFLNGFMVTLPFLIILSIIIVLVRIIIRFIKPISHVIAPGTEKDSFVFVAIALLIVCLFFLLVGIFVGTRQGKRIFAFGENKLLKPIPYYSTISNIVEQFRGQGERPFQQVVLVDPYKSGALMTAFLVEKINEDMVVVYVPTAPNPTNGFVFHMNKQDVIYTNAKTEDAMASVIGMGAGSKKLFKHVIDQQVNQDQ